MEIGDLLTSPANSAQFVEGSSLPTWNDDARNLQALLARYHKDTNFSQLTTGTNTAYALTTFRTIASYAAGLEFKCIAHLACASGATTFRLNALATKPLVRCDGSNLVVGDIVQHQPLHIVYVSSTDKFHLIGVNA